MGKKQLTAKIISQTKLADGIYDMRLQAEEIAACAKPGQFISVYVNDKSKILPRPISICGIDAEGGSLRIVYRIAGEGTKQMAGYKAGDTVKILGPLGNGFTMKPEKAVLIGGGIGIPPMLELAKQLEREGQRPADAAKAAAKQSGFKKSEIYQGLLREKQEG